MTPDHRARAAADILSIAACCPPDRLVLVLMADGTPMPGRVSAAITAAGAAVPGWIRIDNAEGSSLVNLTQVQRIDLADRVMPQPQLSDERALPRPMSKDRPGKVGSKAPGRPWTDDDLRTLADAFLDNCSDPDAAERFHRTRSQIRDLRQGFECNRGNLTDDEISPAATTWVDRWRRVLRSS